VRTKATHPEVRLEGIDALTADEGHQRVGVVKMPSVKARLLLRRVCLNLHGHALARTRHVHSLSMRACEHVHVYMHSWPRVGLHPPHVHSLSMHAREHACVRVCMHSLLSMCMRGRMGATGRGRGAGGASTRMPVCRATCVCLQVACATLAEALGSPCSPMACLNKCICRPAADAGALLL